jgi:N-acetylneuraminic acid mutarotase
MRRYRLVLLMLLALALQSAGGPAPVALGQATAATPTASPRPPQAAPRPPAGSATAPRATQPNRALSGDGMWDDTLVAPPLRSNHTAVWDIPNAQMLVFGGKSVRAGAATNDLWSYRLITNKWVPLQPPGLSPGIHESHTAVWDNLWSYKPSTNRWTQPMPSGTLPPDRTGHTAVWAPSGGQMLVFGGNAFQDIWVYHADSNAWSQFIQSTMRPTARSFHTAVWDTLGGRMLIFGGQDSSGRPLNDLWSYELSSNTWARLSPDGLSPSERYEHSAVWDPLHNQMLIFGGHNPAGGRHDDLWVYQATTNTWLSATGTGPLPAARERHTAIWDATNARMLVFAGLGQHDELGDLWSYEPSSKAWSQLPPIGVRPSPRAGLTATWDVANDRLLVFGGGAGTAVGVFNELWSYQPGTDWSKVTSVGQLPPARQNHTAVWDPVNAQMLVFGGWTPTADQSDLWAFRPSVNAWLELSPQGAGPAARSGHSAIWDPVVNQMLVFGGSNRAGMSFSDLWSYQPTSNIWTHLVSASIPRHYHAASWDTINNQMLVFGGQTNGTCCLNDLWSYQPTNASWKQLNPFGALPPPRGAHTAVWNPLSAQMLVFGGFDHSGHVYNTLWSYQPWSNVWMELSSAGTLPSVRGGHGAVWDSRNSVLRIFGGWDPSAWGLLHYDLWTYAPPIPPPTPTPTVTATTTSTATRTPTATNTATPNVTSTPTLTPFPRPNVGVTAVPTSGAAALGVTLTARDANCTPNNQLQALRFTRLTNATVDVPGVGTISAPSATPIPLTSHPASIVITVRRVTAGQPATAELTVTDGCGDWPTFVGGGPGAF